MLLWINKKESLLVKDILYVMKSIQHKKSLNFKDNNSQVEKYIMIFNLLIISSYNQLLNNKKILLFKKMIFNHQLNNYQKFKYLKKSQKKRNLLIKVQNNKKNKHKNYQLLNKKINQKLLKNKINQKISNNQHGLNIKVNFICFH